MYIKNSTTPTKCQFDTHAVMNSLPTTFTHNAFGDVRVIMVDCEPWFIANDIASILGYARPNDAITAHCKAYELIRINTVNYRGNPNMMIIPERDVYRLIMKSKLPAAEQFEEWVVGEVLPSIRKHGMYGTPEFIESALADPETMIRTLQALKETQQQRDCAIATKAWISRKREATAMNKASQLSKENTRLREQVGDSKTYKQARAIPWLGDFFKLDRTAYIQIGKRLTKESKTLGYEIKEVPHSKYGSVKVYHADVIHHFKHKLISDLNFMRRYRKY